MNRERLGLLVAGFSTACALFFCWLGEWWPAWGFVALCGGALAVAGEANQ